jgi:hypothetical protein
MHVAWLGSFSHLTISPNLHDIWPMFFLFLLLFEQRIF